MFRSRHEFNPYIVGSSIDEGMWGLSKQLLINSVNNELNDNMNHELSAQGDPPALHPDSVRGYAEQADRLASYFSLISAEYYQLHEHNFQRILEKFKNSFDEFFQYEESN